MLPAQRHTLLDDVRLPRAAADPAKLRTLARRPSARGTGVAAPARGPAAVATATAAARSGGSPTVGLVVACLDRVARGARPRPTGDGIRLASPRLPPILDVEESSPHGSTVGPARHPRADPHHVGRESAVGALRIHGELLKLGIDVSQATVARYMVRRRSPPSQTWRTFLANHRAQIVAGRPGARS